MYRLILAVGLLASVLSTYGCAAPVAGGRGVGPATEVVGTAASTELVVLVHGMGRTRYSMLPLARALDEEGYDVVNWGYSSVCCTIAELGADLAAELRGVAGTRTVHFVGHSLGNIVVRWVLASEPRLRTGRVVMLAPPNQGSHEADRLAPWLGWLLKPLAEIRTDPASTARTLPLPAEVEVGIIAGRDDGKVDEEETYLAGAVDHVVVPAVHSFLMFRRDVTALTLEFLRVGSFDRCEPAPDGVSADCWSASEPMPQPASSTPPAEAARCEPGSDP